MDPGNGRPSWRQGVGKRKSGGVDSLLALSAGLQFSDDSVPLLMATSVRHTLPKLQLLLARSNDAPSLMQAGFLAPPQMSHYSWLFP